MAFALSKYLSFALFVGAAIPMVFTGDDYSDITGIKVGNGIAPNPTKKELLISAPSKIADAKTGKPFYRIYSLKFENGAWCCKSEVPFSSTFNDYHPVFSPDGRWIYFNSNRPLPGQQNPSETVNIWRVDRTNGQWGKPEYLGGINTLNHESYPSLTNKGTLYFNSDRPGGKGSMDIYKSELKYGKFTEPVLVEELSSADSENDLAVDPQERFIIFNRYLLHEKEIELYISYNRRGSWTKPKPLEKINIKGVWELTPTISPKGKFLFYEVDGAIKKVDLKQIACIK